MNTLCKQRQEGEREGASLAPSQQIEFSRALHRSHRHMIIVVVFIAQISNVTSVFDAAQPELLRCWGVNATGANLKVAQGHCGPARYDRCPKLQSRTFNQGARCTVWQLDSNHLALNIKTGSISHAWLSKKNWNHFW